MAETATPHVHAASLATRFCVPGGWTVACPARLTSAVMGVVAADLAVLAPGPEGCDVHRAQLVVFFGDGERRRGRLVGDLATMAAADVPEAWHIELERGWTVVYRAPWWGRYRSRTLVYPGEAVVPLALSRLEVVPLPRRRAR